MRALATALVLLALVGGSQAAGRTDIARVDEYIDAPRALFGRTRAELERRLGAPAGERRRTGGVALSWPGLEVTLSAPGLTALEDNAKPQPLVLDFTKSVAPLKLINKTPK